MGQAVDAFMKMAKAALDPKPGGIKMDVLTLMSAVAELATRIEVMEQALAEMTQNMMEAVETTNRTIAMVREIKAMLERRK